jgi:prolyl-tRNA synthetase
LGQIVQDKVTQIVVEEFEDIEAQRVTFGALVPRTIFEKSGRWTDYGPSLFKLTDRRGSDYLLAPTHEELFTLLAKDQVSSYRDLPVTLFQIQTKFRDEVRPRAGVIRGREFVMADSYSFDIDDEGLQQSYATHRRAFSRMFERMGIEFDVVTAVSGAMGGSASEEFLAISDSGEDTFARCPNGDFAANIEAIPVTPARRRVGEVGPFRRISTPGAATIVELVQQLQAESTEPVDPSSVLKAVMFKCGDRSVMALVPGDREVNQGKVEDVVGAEVEPFGEDDFRSRTRLIRGYLSPVGLAEEGVEVIADASVVDGSAWVVGGNVVDTHLADAVVGRDFEVSSRHDLVSAVEGDSCPRCGAALLFNRGIEVGHIFQLGQKYSKVFDLRVLNAAGRAELVTMGSYGVGVSRALGIIAEQRADDRGLRWPASVAPAHVHLVPAQGKDGDVQQAAIRLAGELEARGIACIVDDRPKLSYGARVADAELIGAPFILVLGRRLVEGIVELKDRTSGETSDVSLQELPDRLAALLGIDRFGEADSLGTEIAAAES